MSKGSEFRRLLQENDYIYSTGVTGALDASIAERVGLKFVYMSGYSTSLALLAKADLGFLSSTEMVSHAAQIANATSLPVIADADDGFGNALTVMRTVESYEKAGVAGIHIEDQVAPKRCGHLAGKRVLPLDEAVGKFKAALAARQDPDFIIIARTDARDAEDGNFQEAIRRGRTYASLGADMVSSEFGDPDALAEFEQFAEEVQKERPGIPLVFNYSSSLKWGTSKNRISFRQLSDMGYKVILVSMGCVHAAMKASWDFMADLRENAEQAQFRQEEAIKGHPTENHHAMGNIALYEKLTRDYVR